MSTMTIDDVNNRNYTYVSINNYTFDDNGFICDSAPLKILVSSPYIIEAQAKVRIYMELHKLTCSPEDISYYPRNYIVKARKLFAEGKFY